MGRVDLKGAKQNEGLLSRLFPSQTVEVMSSEQEDEQSEWTGWGCSLLHLPASQPSGCSFAPPPGAAGGADGIFLGFFQSLCPGGCLAILFMAMDRHSVVWESLSISFIYLVPGSH